MTKEIDQKDLNEKTAFDLVQHLMNQYLSNDNLEQN